MTVQNVPSPVVHRVTLNPESETRKAKTRLDEVLDEKEMRAAQRYSAAEMEKMALEAENEAARLRGEPPKYKHYGGGEMDEDEKRKAEEKQAQQKGQLMGSAKALIDSGMEPAQVGQMLLGLPTTGSAPAVAQGMGLDDVIKIIALVTEKKETSELKSVIKDLEKKVEDLAKNPPVPRTEAKTIDPITFAKQQAEAVAAWHKALRELIPPQEPRSESGEPLEVVKERNRHDERMDEIKADREYKSAITEIAGDIPERVGHGMASQYAEMEGRGNGGKTSGGLDFIKCECGQKIYTPPGAAQAKCPKCGLVYARGEEKVEAEAGQEG